MRQQEQRLIKPPPVDQDDNHGCGAADLGVAERLREMVGDMEGLSRLTTPKQKTATDRHPYRPFDSSDPESRT
jgi:hypothetical protein